MLHSSVFPLGPVVLVESTMAPGFGIKSLKQYSVVVSDVLPVLGFLQGPVFSVAYILALSMPLLPCLTAKWSRGTEPGKNRAWHG